MSILSWILLGLVAGALAKFLMSGDDPGGILITILLGIAGAFVGGFIGTAIGFGSVQDFSFGSVATATGGAFLLLFAHRKFSGRKA